MKRYPKLKYPDHEDSKGLTLGGEVVITEKLDGSNFRFTYTDSERFTFGSRNTYGDELNRDQFEKPIEYITENVDTDRISDLQSEHGKLTFFGEAMLPHTISYDWVETPMFVGFDVWSVESEIFLHSDHAREIFNGIGLEYTPVIDVVDAEELDPFGIEIPSSVYYDGLAEGVVLKNHSTGVYSKLVREEFKEKAKQTFGASSKQDLSDTELIVEQYITPARVRSVVHQLLDDGEYTELQMEMMEDLPERAIRDAMLEEGGNIVMTENVKLNTSEMRSIVSKRCVRVLRQMIDMEKRGQNDWLRNEV